MLDALRQVAQAWLPRLSRRVWIGLACVYAVTLFCLYLKLPVHPAITLRSATPVAAIGFANENKTLATLDVRLDEIGRLDGFTPLIRLWDLSAGTFVDKPEILWEDFLRNATLAPDGATIVLEDTAGNTSLYDLTTQKLLLKVAHERGLFGFSPGGTWYLVDTSEGDFVEPPHLVNTRTGECWRPISKRPSLQWNRYQFAPDESTVFLRKYDREEECDYLERWDLIAQRMVWAVPLSDYRIDLAPDGTIIATAREDNTIEFRDAATGQRIRDGGKPTFKFQDLSFDPSGTKVIVMSRTTDGFGYTNMESLDVRTGATVFTLPHSVTMHGGACVHAHQRPMRDVSGAAQLALLYDATTNTERLVRLADGAILQFRGDRDLALFDQVSPNADFVVRKVVRNPDAKWYDRLPEYFMGRELPEESYVVQHLGSWRRSLVLPENYFNEVTPVFSQDSSRLATQTVDFHVIQVWDLPPRPPVLQLLLWALVSNGVLFLIVCWWSKARRQTVD